MLNSIVWDVNPVFLALGPLEIRWYGLLYALGFFIGITIIGKMFKHDGAPDGWLDKVFIWMVVAVIVGARLGHVFFYAWDYYKENPAEIFMIWHGGLASHGGAIAMIITGWLFSKYVTKQSFFWLADRVFPASTLVAGMIRLGNLMNSEIYGEPTNMPWGFIFVRGGERFYGDQGQLLACHPTQLYEAGAYFLLFIFMMWLYWKRDGGNYNGLLTGIGLTGIFTARFLIELVKNDQEAFEADMFLNMGQLLSIPFIIVGIYLIIRAIKKGKVVYHLPKQEVKPDPKQTTKPNTKNKK